MSKGLCKDCGKEVDFNDDGYGSPQCDSCWRKSEKLPPKQPLPEPEGMDDVFSKICELISIGQKGRAKKIFKQALSTRSEGWATDEDMENAFTEGMACMLERRKSLPDPFEQWFADYKLKKGRRDAGLL